MTHGRMGMALLLTGLVLTQGTSPAGQASGSGVISTAAACRAASGDPGAPPPATGYAFTTARARGPLAVEALIDPHASLARWVDGFARLAIARSLLQAVLPNRGALTLTIALAGAEAGSDGQIRMTTGLPATLPFPDPPKLSIFTLAATRAAVDAEYGYRCRAAARSLAVAHAAADRAARGIYRLGFRPEQAPSRLAAGLALAAAQLAGQGAPARIIVVSDLRGTEGTAVRLPFRFPPRTEVILVVDLAAGLGAETPLVTAWRAQLAAAGAARVTVLYPTDSSQFTNLFAPD